jgi:hypothetical protein
MSRRTDILDVFDSMPEGRLHWHTSCDREHGGDFVTCLNCGAQWSVHDTLGPECFDFDRVSEGNGYCDDRWKGDKE